MKEFDGLHKVAQGKLLAVIQRYMAGQLRRQDFKKLADDVWELRVEYLNNPQRILFFKWREDSVALTCFHKKDQKTPSSRIKLAQARRQEWIDGSEPD